MSIFISLNGRPANEDEIAAIYKNLGKAQEMGARCIHENVFSYYYTAGNLANDEGVVIYMDGAQIRRVAVYVDGVPFVVSGLGNVASGTFENVIAAVMDEVAAFIKRLEKNDTADNIIFDGGRQIAKINATCRYQHTATGLVKVPTDIQAASLGLLQRRILAAYPTATADERAALLGLLSEINGFTDQAA